MKQFRRIKGNDLVKEFIVYSTAKNILNRKVKELPSKKNILLSSELANYLHDIKTLMEKQSLKMIKRGDTASPNEYLYSIFNNGWRSDHEIAKSTIQSEVTEIIKDIQKSESFIRKLEGSK